MAKLDIGEIVKNVKSMIVPAAIPEVGKDDPIGYYLSEISKYAKSAAQLSEQQATVLAKLDASVGELHQQLTMQKNQTTTVADVQTTEKKTEEKK